jgi:stearoyl-CoA desaturase (delta-9 desaturase)
MIVPDDGSEGSLSWPMVGLHVVFHSLALLALWFWSWSAFAVALLLWWVAGSLGIGIGYHRLLTHRAFKTPKWVEYVLTLCGTLALEGPPIAWAARHRAHHQHADAEHDPHSPSDGVFWSHIGWVLQKTPVRWEAEASARYAPDLARDRFHRWLSDWHFLPEVVLAAALYAMGGLRFVLWGIFARVVFSWHAAMAVNSVGHRWGTRRFDTNDESRNNWWVALISHGEGWHNNHHAHPTAARHGLAWYEIDVNWYGIRVLETLGLAEDVRVPAPPGGLPRHRRGARGVSTIETRKVESGSAAGDVEA